MSGLDLYSKSRSVQSAKTRYDRLRTSLVMQLRSKVHTLLSHYFLDVEGFLGILKVSDSVVSGLAALSLCVPGVEPSHLDVFAPNERANIFEDFLVGEGYNIAAKHVPKGPAFRVSPLVRVTVYAKLGNADNVFVFESTSSSAIFPIIEYQSTALMNFISCCEIFMAYPKLTSRRLMMENRNNAFELHREIDKCVDHGFSFLRPNKHSGWHRNSCIECNHCPGKLRSSGDGLCLRQKFAFVPDGYAFQDFTWRLGGRCWLNEDEEFEPFLHST